jgi:hypothetical protein
MKNYWIIFKNIKKFIINFVVYPSPQTDNLGALSGLIKNLIKQITLKNMFFFYLWHFFIIGYFLALGKITVTLAFFPKSDQIIIHTWPIILLYLTAFLNFIIFLKMFVNLNSPILCEKKIINKWVLPFYLIVQIVICIISILFIMDSMHIVHPLIIAQVSILIENWDSLHNNSWFLSIFFITISVACFLWWHFGVIVYKWGQLLQDQVEGDFKNSKITINKWNRKRLQLYLPIYKIHGLILIILFPVFLLYYLFRFLFF